MILQHKPTRPETMFGDTAIATHPNNKKLKKFIGKNALVLLFKNLSLLYLMIMQIQIRDQELLNYLPDFNDFLIGKHHLNFINT